MNINQNVITNTFKILTALLLSTHLLEAKHIHKESYYQNIFCKNLGGITEYILDDKTRVDCLTSEYAIEVDFAQKWAEGIGQALYYSLKTDRKSGVLLIMEDLNHTLYLDRLKRVAKQYNIDIWTVHLEEGKEIFTFYPHSSL